MKALAVLIAAAAWATAGYKINILVGGQWDHLNHWHRTKMMYMLEILIFGPLIVFTLVAIHSALDQLSKIGRVMTQINLTKIKSRS